MSRRRFVQFLRTAPVFMLSAAFLPREAYQAAATQRCFPEAAPAITSCIDGRFRPYWEANGGLAVFGYPLTQAQPERNRDTGATYLTQYFERQRFELHPENAAPYDVLLGRLGADLQPAWQSAPKVAPSTPHYSPETGHAIGAAFVGYWSSHGLNLGDAGTSARESLALFGHPITEPAIVTNSSGDTVLTQYFERARLEEHVDSGGQRVLQGRLGSEERERPGDDSPQPSGSATPSPSASPSTAPSASPSASPEPSDDKGGDDDAQPSGSAAPSASPEASDDKGDDTAPSASASPASSPEASDDHGGHGGDDAQPSASPAASDDHGGHGGDD